MAYNTIGRCEDCQKENRYLDQMDFVETEDGYVTIYACAYGCDDEHSKAKPVTEMIEKLLQKEIKQLKQDLRKTKTLPGKVRNLEEIKDLQRKIRIYQDIQKFSRTDWLNIDDWSRIIGVSNRWKAIIINCIIERKKMKQTAKCIADVEQLEEEKWLFHELHRYAKGKCM